VELYAKARAGAMEDARAMHKKLEALVFSPLLRGDLWQVMKLGLAMQGVSVGAVCRPRFSAPFGQAAIDELRGLLTSCGVETL
jgi:dihydrodipicolinate synthase/N-acetylneuraminate lyase